MSKKAAHLVDTLVGAREILANGKWCQGDYHREDGAVCLVGALQASARAAYRKPSGQEFVSTDDRKHRKVQDAVAFLAPLIDAEKERAYREEADVRHLLAEGGGIEEIVTSWNDVGDGTVYDAVKRTYIEVPREKKRKRGEVLRLLDRAIKKARATAA